MIMKSLFWSVSKTSKILARLYSEALYIHGLNSAQANVILALDEFEKKHENPTQNDLAQNLVSDKVSLHQLLRKLERMEYVTRRKNEADHRCNFVALTIKGRYLISQIRIIEANISSYFEKYFLSERLDEFISSLNKFIAEETQ